MNTDTALAVAIAVFSAVPGMSQDRQAVNLDFEAGRGGPDTAAVGWRTLGESYSFALDSSIRHSGRYSMRTRRVGSGGFGLVSQTVAVTAHAGGTVRVSGFVRTEDVAEGYAGLWARVDGVRSGLAMDNMSDRGATETAPWTRYEIELPVEDCATHVVFGPIHPGSGTAWFDDLAIEFQPTIDRGTLAADCSPASQEYNLDFERSRSQASQLPEGWTPTSGEPPRLDSIVRYSGRYSVRLDQNASESTSLIREIRINRVAGRRVALRGRVRSAGDASGTSIFLRVRGPDSTTTRRSELRSSVAADAPWAELSVAAAIDPCANTLWVGIENSRADTAWFDRLSLSVDGGALPAAPSRSPAPTPEVDRERLLSDRELAIAPDDCAPPEDETWSAWAAENAVPIRSITSDDFADLQFLKDVLRDKRVVQLGESGHGVEPFNMAKTRLIKFLHQEMGFDVIAFESSLEECYHANQLIAESTADDLMRNCIFGVWHTDEVVKLFEYIKQTAATSHPLILAGFDTQTSSRLASSRPARLGELIAHVDSAKANRVEEMDASALARLRGAESQTPPLAQVRDSIVALYEELALYLRDRTDALAESPEVDRADVLVAIRAARSMMHFIRQRSVESGVERTMARDSGMAENLNFLLDELYPDKKVITWGHNFHLRRRNQDVSPNPVKTMGAWVAERRREEIYTVGLYMYRGEAALNNRQVYDVFRASPGSLESILHRTGLKYQYMDLARQTRHPGTEWMFVPIPAKTWGQSDVTMVLRDQYDGILFIDTVWPPSYR